MARHCIRSRARLSVVASLFDDDDDNDDADDNDDDDDAVAGANQHNLVLFFISLHSSLNRRENGAQLAATATPFHIHHFGIPFRAHQA